MFIQNKEKKSFPIFSPQGDGNLVKLVAVKPILDSVFSYLFPARGRKHFLLSHPNSSTSLFLSFPRKGTETAVLGRKHKRLAECLFLSFPRKGTETCIVGGSRAMMRFLSFPIFSPQGDGNGKLEALELSNLVVVFSYLFPARGRKPRVSNTPC